MKKLLIAVMVLGLMSVASFAVFAGPVFAGSGVMHWYLYPDAENVTVASLTPEGVAKLTYNRDTGDYILRGHGLLAGREFEIRSNGDINDEGGIGVGNGETGVGNNVLIKGNLVDQDINCDDLGKRWNLFMTNNDVGGVFVRILATYDNDVSPREFCNGF